MMRIIMLVDVTVPIRGRGAKMHYHHGRTYVVDDAFGEDCCRNKQARLFDAPVEEENEQEVEAARRRLRIERIKQDFAGALGKVEDEHQSKAAEVKANRPAVREELGEAEPKWTKAGEVPLKQLSTTEQECVKWLGEL